MTVPKISKRAIKITVVVIVVLVVIMIVKKIISPSTAAPTAAGAIVNAVTAKEASWHVQIQSTGTINTFKGAMLKAQVSGPVTAIYFESGTMVKAGDKLIQIYPDIVAAQLEKNKAILQLKLLTYQRYANLYKKNVVSQQDLDTAYSNWQQSIADVQDSEATLRQYNVTAPFDGMVGLRQVSVGEYLNVGSEIVDLEQVDPIRVDFSVPDIYVDEIAVGQKVSIVSSADQTKSYDGQVTAINSAVDPTTRSIALWGSVPNASHTLLPGSYAVVTLYSLKTHPVVTIPQTALSYDSSGGAVYKIVDGIARKTNVTIGMRQGNEVSIASGLAAGDVVVSDGIIKIQYDGQPVQIAALDGKTVAASAEKK
ncbi:MAG: efflux transporter periplasmic adaptor subunit [Gammaproteobacteria bacterium]|jgi:membrane fusion protein (multidrug efflux system)|nr:efflux transporter periplasmic adaptor subunit [Gammaproteobacteria bacterium]